MLILTDNEIRATEALALPGNWLAARRSGLSEADLGLWEELAPGRRCFQMQDSISADDFWKRLIVIDEAPASQFDALRSLYSRPSQDRAPTACLALTGTDFHGHRGRSWTACRGNLHLSVVLFPGAPAAEIGLAMTMLPAVAVMDSLQSFPSIHDHGPGGAGIKWVNDLHVGGAKIAGVLTTTLSLGEQLEQVVLGIGMNLLVKPYVEPTVFVPRVTSLAEEVSKDLPDLRRVLTTVLSAIRDRYRQLLSDGPGPLFGAYREASLVVGREVVVWPESSVESGSPKDWPRPLATGKVLDIKPDLSLIVAGRDEAVTHGRLAFSKDISE